MDRLQAMQMFVRVVETNSFHRAAETLGVSPSSITSAIKNLEAHLGTRLLQRTTRRLHLTVHGSTYYEHCRRVISDIDAIEAGLQSTASKPTGALRVNLPGSIARTVIVPGLKAFQKAYPRIDLTLSLSDRTIDLVEEGVDCVIRTGELKSTSTLSARQVGEFRWVSCASPVYLDLHGSPASLDDLLRHQAIHYVSGVNGRRTPWVFMVDGDPVSISPPGSLAVNDTEACLACGLEGLGLIQLGSFLLEPYLQSGRLRTVLEDVASPRVPISVLYPRTRQMNPAVRAFVDWIAALFEQTRSLQRRPESKPRAARPTVQVTTSQAP